MVRVITRERTDSNIAGSNGFNKKTQKPVEVKEEKVEEHANPIGQRRNNNTL